MHVCVCVSMHMCMSLCVNACVYVYILVYLYIRMFVCAVCLCEYICVVRVRACVYMHICT